MNSMRGKGFVPDEYPVIGSKNFAFGKSCACAYVYERYKLGSICSPWASAPWVKVNDKNNVCKKEGALIVKSYSPIIYEQPTKSTGTMMGDKELCFVNRFQIVTD
eukprot:4679036-Amphidinium_carterae.1